MENDDVHPPKFVHADSWSVSGHAEQVRPDIHSAAYREKTDTALQAA